MICSLNVSPWPCHRLDKTGFPAEKFPVENFPAERRFPAALSAGKKNFGNFPPETETEFPVDALVSIQNAAKAY